MSEPKVEAEPQMASGGKGRRGRFAGVGGGTRRWLRRAVITLALIAAIPAGLTFVYAVPAVHPLSTLMLWDIVTGRGYDRRWVPLDQISPALVYSVIMSEDGQFCRHRGIDWGEMRGVVEDALEGEPTRGASTITMQTVKNLFLWGGRSYVRKALEAPLALYFDAVLSKRRIMEIYLNIAQWGPGIYGVEAGAEHHFKRPAAQLSGRQAALLAVTLPNPFLRHPERPTPGLRRLALLIERRVAHSGDYVQCVK